MDLINRIRRSFAQRGLFATAQLCAVELLWKVLPRFRRTVAQRTRADVEFDTRHGVDTAGVFRPRPAQVIGSHWAFGIHYEPVDPDAFLRVMRGLQIRYSDFTFVDLGSGKGRSLLLASLFPFEQIIGVEYCPELNRIARQNALRFRPPERACSSIEVLDLDAAEYQFPATPLVLFFFNPFSRQVMQKVITNLQRSFSKSPRSVRVVYFFPELAELWERSGLFTRLQSSPAVFQNLSCPASDRVDTPLHVAER